MTSQNCITFAVLRDPLGLGNHMTSCGNRREIHLLSVHVYCDGLKNEKHFTVLHPDYGKNKISFSISLNHA